MNIFEGATVLLHISKQARTKIRTPAINHKLVDATCACLLVVSQSGARIMHVEVATLAFQENPCRAT